MKSAIIPAFVSVRKDILKIKRGDRGLFYSHTRLTDIRYCATADSTFHFLRVVPVIVVLISAPYEIAI